MLLAASLVFAAVGAVIKWLSSELPFEMIVFFRNSLGLLAFLPWLVHAGRGGLATKHFRLHLTRMVAGLSAMYCYFYSIAYLQLGEATLLTYTSPLFTPFIASVWLGEPIPRGIGKIALLGFAGVVLLLKPGLGFLSGAGLIALIAGFLTAVAFVGIRGLSRSEPTIRIVFYFTILASAVSAVPLLWTWETPRLGLWPPLLLMGGLANLGQILLTRAYAHAPAARIGPLSYATVAFAAVFGWAVWGEVPHVFSIFGAALVFAAGVMAIHSMGAKAPKIVAEEPILKPETA